MYGRADGRTQEDNVNLSKNVQYPDRDSKPRPPKQRTEVLQFERQWPVSKPDVISSSVFNRPVDLVAKWISVTYNFMDVY
jgi:hypothetical protein